MIKDDELKQMIETNSRMVFYAMDWEDVFDKAELIKDRCGGYNQNALGNLQTLDRKSCQWASASAILPGDQWRLVFYIPPPGYENGETPKKPFEYSELLIAAEVWEMSHLREAGRRYQDKRFYLNTFFCIQLVFLFCNVAFYAWVRANVCK